MPASRRAPKEQIIKGHVPVQARRTSDASDKRVQLLGSGTILRESLAAQTAGRRLGRGPTCGAARASTELTREGQDVDRWNLLHPLETPACRSWRSSWATAPGPVVASTDYMKAYAEQIRPFIPRGRNYKACWAPTALAAATSATKLREHFEVNRHYIVVAALKALAKTACCPPPRWPGDCQVRHQC